MLRVGMGRDLTAEPSVLCCCGWAPARYELCCGWAQQTKSVAGGHGEPIPCGELCCGWARQPTNFLLGGHESGLGRGTRRKSVQNVQSAWNLPMHFTFPTVWREQPPVRKSLRTATISRGCSTAHLGQYLNPGLCLGRLELMASMRKTLHSEPQA